MFDFARAYVAAIATALGKMQAAARRPDGLQEHTDPALLELPRFLAATATAQPYGYVTAAARHASAAGKRAHAIIQRFRRSLLARNDAGLLTVTAIALVLLFAFSGVAPGSNARNPEADAIATRFAFAAARSESAALEDRLDFAPRFAIALTARQKDGVRLTLASQTPANRLPFDALGAILLTGLPEGTSLSAGLDLGHGQWVVSQGDLDRLEMSIPNLLQSALVRIQVLSRDGVANGSLSMTLTPTGVVEASLDGASPIRTGALSRVAPALRDTSPPRQTKTRAPRKERARAKPDAKAARSLQTAPNVVKLQFTQTGPLTPPLGSPVLLFKPTSSAPPKEPKVQSAQGASFPRSPMEEEAARR